MKRTLIRTLGPMAAVIAIILMSATSASAAGPPKIGHFWLTSGYQSVLNEWGFETNINPNGASTTYYVEYGLTNPTPPKPWERTTPGVGIGAGTAEVHSEQPLPGLNPNSTYYFRIKATNSFGTTFSEVNHATSARWEGGCGGCAPPWEFPETYSSRGTLKLEQAGSAKMTITCNERGQGVIGNHGGIGDFYELELRSCAVEGLPECTVTSPGMILKPNFEGSEKIDLEMHFAETKCGGIWPVEQFATKPFRATLGLGAEVGAVVQPLTLTQNTTFGLTPVTITDTSEWSLSGPGLGHKFKWVIWG